MDNLKASLGNLKKVEPSKVFVKRSKNRLIHQIELQKHETWFKSFLSKVGIVQPTNQFVSQAKIRLISQINATKAPAWAWVTFAKRATASTLVMIIAVTATLFFVEGGQIVSASDNTYIEILSGNAKVKHGDLLTWDQISDQQELSAGDLIRLGDDSEAIIHFFDDTELRLDKNSSLLISQLAVSPTFSEQSIIEASLHKGKVWVQTLNVEDGYSGFTLETHDARIHALNSTFDVSTLPTSNTQLRVFRNDIKVDTLNSDTRSEINTFIQKTDQLISINSLKSTIPQAIKLTEQDKANKWVQNNLQKDHEQLLMLRENGFNKLKLTAGTLPGEMLYPIKQAKERLKLAFSFDKEALTDTQIEIANKRLAEAIVLLEKGDKSKALESLTEYQSIARQVVAKKSNNLIGYKLITPHQKALVASLPSSAPIVMVKDALNQTEELLAVSPIDREKIRLENAIEGLEYISYFIDIGDINSAKDALVDHELVVSSIIEEANIIENEDKKNEIFAEIYALRTEELELMETLKSLVETKNTVDARLAAMLNSATIEAEHEVKRVAALVEPIITKESLEQESEDAEIEDTHIQYLVDKINIYNTWQGLKNQINRLLDEEGHNAKNIAFLTELHDNLNGKARVILNTKIVELEKMAAINKSKAIKRKIDRAKRIRRD